MRQKARYGARPPARCRCCCRWRLSEPYTYAVPEGETLAPGGFVVVPLGPMKRIGVVWREGGERKPFDPKKLKSIVAALDVPPLPPVNLAFADWVANYTLAPKGMVLQMMMSAGWCSRPRSRAGASGWAGPRRRA